VARPVATGRQATLSLSSPGLGHLSHPLAEASLSGRGRKPAI